MAGRGRNGKDEFEKYGTGSDDLLDGFSGSFTLNGGNGDDTYIVDDAGDRVIEKDRSGNDSVLSYVDFTLSAQIENLTLLGEADLSGSGNDLDNEITGNAGDNILDGGDGSDSIDGGAGSDTAVYSGLHADHEIEVDGDTIRVIAPDGSVDLLRNIEYIAFSDTTIDVQDLAPPPPAPPVALDDSAALDEDDTIVIAVLRNDVGNGLSVSAANNGAMGHVVINDDGTLTYTPNANSNGADTFSYTVKDSAGLVSSASVTINVASVNDAPETGDDMFSATVDQIFSSTISVLGNDTDVDGDTLTVIDFSPTSQAGGTVEMSPDGTFTYIPAAGFSGSDSFTYTASDGNGGESIGTVSISVHDPYAVPYYVDGLIYEFESWRLNHPSDYGTATTVTYTFLSAVPDYYGSAHFAQGSFSAFSVQQQQMTRDALAMIEAFTNLTFIETATPEAATITFGLADIGGSARGLTYFPEGDPVGTPHSDVWIDIDWAGTSFELGAGDYKTLLHEIGHAIGLDHTTLPALEDNRQFTVMSALPHPTASGDAASYQLYDVAALQHIYGADLGATAGDDVYSFEQLGGLIQTIWDAGGHDLLDMSAAGYAVELNLAEGGFSTTSPTGSNNLAIAFGTSIEDARGSDFDDRIIGNDLGNTITGGAGNDELSGRDGLDVFVLTLGWGHDIITDFSRGKDLIDATALGIGFGDLSITTSDGDTVISYFSDSVTLQSIASIGEGDFIFA